MSVESTAEDVVIEEAAPEVVVDEAPPDEVAEDAAPAGGQSEEASGEADEVVITLGDDAETDEAEDPAKAPAWVRDLRKANREKERQLREKDAEIARLKQASAPAPVVVGERPTLEGCDFDADRYASELERYLERKAAADREAAAKADAERKAQEQWQARLNGYGQAKTALKVKDFDEAEEVARDTFNVVQQSVILKGVRSPEKAAQLIYALGKSPKKAKELAAITDPVEFAVAIGEVIPMLKTQPRKAAPIPERVVRGSSPGAGALDNELARLEAEADRTGDRTKVAAYRRAQMLKQRAA